MIIFGMVVEIKQMSAMERFERKKYMEVWMWESKLTVKMMSRFPNTATRDMNRKSPKSKGYVLWFHIAQTPFKK